MVRSAEILPPHTRESLQRHEFGVEGGISASYELRQPHGERRSQLAQLATLAPAPAPLPPPSGGPYYSKRKVATIKLKIINTFTGHNV